MTRKPSREQQLIGELQAKIAEQRRLAAEHERSAAALEVALGIARKTFDGSKRKQRAVTAEVLEALAGPPAKPAPVQKLTAQA